MSLETKRSRIAFLRDYIQRYHEKNARLVENKTTWIKATWRQVEQEFVSLLPALLETDWPSERKQIRAFISLNPICPRDIDDWSFSVFLNYRKKAYVQEVIMHEICHFLYFKKWREVFPDTDAKTFESPYLEWHLSEILAPVILNDHRIQRLLKRPADFHEEHMAILIQNKPATEYFADLYLRFSKEGKPFAEFLQKAYAEIKKYRTLFETAGNK